ncbi:MAG: ribonuclease J [Acutalibacteraceae bacterium]
MNEKNNNSSLKQSEIQEKPKKKKPQTLYYKKKKTVKKQPAAKAKPKAKPVKISFLGGINEVGKNMTVFEYESDMIIVDCGLSFPDEDMLGIDLVIPDFTFVEKNADKIRGIVITHGHEDHIGGLAYLLKAVNVPVYGTRLTIGLIEGKLKEHDLVGKVSLNTINPGEHVKLGGFDIEFIHVNHSIPDAVGFAIKCGGGTIIHTGDFKIDSTPIDGGMIDLARFGQLGNEGVLCMLADSTNAERPGFTESERKVGDSFEMLFRKAGDRRIIVATFASNIHRVQQIINVAEALGRKVALSGRSLENVVSISRELGYLKVPDGIIIDLDLINKYSPSELVLITTGSQGEPMSALTRMAFSDHRKVAITPNDYVIISATPIPGNEKTVSRVINELMKLGAEVVYEKMYDVHVSGHACREELKLMLGIVKPKYFIPVHGERKHLLKHSQLAESMGVEKKNILIVDNGVCVEVSQDKIKKAAAVPAGQVFVDGLGVGDVGNIVIRDRKHLAEDGIIIVVAAIDSVSGELVSGPEVVSRGFVFVREAEDLIEEARDTAYDAILRSYKKGWNAIKNTVRDDVSKLMYERTKRSPMILPILMEI